MSYYQGDYYQGDYYQGDPFLGALIGMGATWLGKKLLGKGAAAAGTTAIARVGAGATTGLVTGAAAGVMAPMLARLGKIPTPGGGVIRPFRALPGGVPLYTPPAAAPGCCPTGFHMSKDGSGRCVRNRAMNVANPRALRRSLRRVAGFGKLAARARKSMKAAARAV